MHDDRARVLALLRQHGDASTGFQTLEEGFSYAFEDHGCVAYVDTGAAFVAAGPPIGPREHRAAIARRFIERARKLGRRVCFFGTDRSFAEHAGLDVLAIGEEPSWDPRVWPTTLTGSRKLREQLRRARAKRVCVRTVSASEVASEHPTRLAIDRLITEWLASRPLAAMGFLVDVRPFEFADERVYAVAERDGRLVAFAAAVPIHATRGFLLEDLVRARDAPNGTAELVIDHVFRELAAREVAHVTLGLAPLSGEVPRALELIARWTRRLYNFEGVRAFKARLRPSQWLTVHLALPPSSSRVLAVHDVLRAFATGGFVRFGLHSLHRQRRAVALVLGALLLPWVCLLAFPVGTPWFPSPAIRAAWIAFDVALAMGLVALFRSWRPGLATVLALVTALDALLTFVQVVAWDLPRVDGMAAAFAVTLAVLAPSVATAFLWYSRRPLIDATSRVEPASTSAASVAPAP